MALRAAGAGVLEAIECESPTAAAGQLRVRVRACAVCRTDLHIVDGELPPTGFPRVPGHEIVGVVDQVGPGVAHVALGDRVGIPWLGYSCGACSYCRSEQENLCPAARFTGYHLNGGYAEYTVVDARFAFPIPDQYGDLEAAPLLCAGLIGYRAYKMIGDAQRLGLYGFGAAAHIIAQLAVYDGRDVFAFTPPGRQATQAFARTLGAKWAGGSDEAPPELLEAAIVFAPVGALVPEALSRLVPGGIVVCAGIHMSDIPAFPYRLLWQERIVRSVANLTRQDAREFLALAPRVPIRTQIRAYSLDQANAALEDLRAGRVQGTAVLVVT
jgi:propanol-preferring alcohol dehydrogenase